MAFATRERTAYHELSLSRRRKGYTGAWEVGIGANEKIGHEKVGRWDDTDSINFRTGFRLN